MMRRAAIICVGDELLDGRVNDINSDLLKERLTAQGLEVILTMTVADDIEEISSAVRLAVSECDITVVTGGLGPTPDDLTREGVADALGRRLVKDESLVLWLKERFREYGREMPPSNLRQAQIIEGTSIIMRGKGTAPGLFIEEEGRGIYLLPGVPTEMREMLDEFIIPSLHKKAGEEVYGSRTFRVFGCTEAEVGELVDSLLVSRKQVRASYLVRAGEIEVRLWGKGDSEGEIDGRLDELAEQIKSVLGERVVSDDGKSLPEVVAELMGKGGCTLSVAESCTGGMLGECITEVPGSSAFFLGGVISYSMRIKNSVLGVPDEIIRTKGVVSVEVARAMAEGVRELFRSDISLSVTGVAGPEGGTREVPVGTVCLALSHQGGAEVRKVRLPGDRSMVRRLAANAAMMMLVGHLRRGHNE